jgi:hypothetical protein
MKTQFFKQLTIVALLIYAPLQSMAWGTTGHRVCGQIAESYLTPKARTAVHAILGDESIAMASNWADFIRSDPQYSYTSSWHYVDLNKVYTYPELVDFLNHDTNVDAYTKIMFLMSDLKKTGLSKFSKQFDLKMLIHLVEDVHQPMHVAHADDKGGNDFKVSWFGQPTNLHAVWDSKMIDDQQLSYTEYATAINHTTAAQRAEWQSAPVSKWLFESNQIAEILYTDIKQDDNLTYKYNYSHIDTLNRQLLKAGVRLAGVLNKLFS